MSDPVSYLAQLDSAACHRCDTRKRLEDEIDELRKRRDDLLRSNNEFEQRYREVKREIDELRTMKGGTK
jgi:uncharacterized coiled-coil DUF342 family protein